MARASDTHAQTRALTQTHKWHMAAHSKMPRPVATFTNATRHTPHDTRHATCTCAMAQMPRAQIMPHDTWQQHAHMPHGTMCTNAATWTHMPTIHATHDRHATWQHARRRTNARRRALSHDHKEAVIFDVSASSDMHAGSRRRRALTCTF